MAKSITFDQFIINASKIHNKYDYSKVKFTKNFDEIIIICPIHGDFKQRVRNHLSGSGCRTCARKTTGNKTKFSLEEYIKIANNKHKNKYDYSKSVYLSVREPITIICPIHGNFICPRAGAHIGNNPSGCPKCYSERHNWSLKEFIEKSNKVHYNFYTYDKAY